MLKKINWLAIELMNQMRFGMKMAVMLFFFLTPLVVFICVYISNLNEDIKVAEDKKFGVEIIDVLDGLVTYLQEHRGLSQAAMSDADENVLTEIENLETKIETCFYKLDSCFRASQKLPILSINLDNMEDNWLITKTEFSKKDYQESWKLHTTLIRQIINYVGVVADNSGLMQDTATSTYYLMQVIKNHTFDLNEYIGQARGLGTGIISRKTFGTEGKESFVNYPGLISSSAEEVRKQLVYASSSNNDYNSLVRNYNVQFDTKTVEFIKCIKTIILDESFDMQALDYFDKGTQAISASRILLTGGLNIIKHNCDESLSLFKRKKTWIIVILLVYTFVLVYFSLGNYFSISNSLDLLTKKTLDIEKGNFIGGLDLGTRDELNDLALLISKTAKSLHLSREALVEKTNSYVSLSNEYYAQNEELVMIVEEIEAKNEDIHLVNNKLEKSIAELELAKSRAEESDNLKSAFLANMSHEIRTPMNAILGFTELIKKMKNNDEKTVDFLTIIMKNGRQLLRIINDIIDFSKIEAGQLNINLEAVRISQIIRELGQLFAPELALKNLKLHVNLPDTDEDHIINTDEVRLKQILINLIGNAIKFTDDGSITIGYMLDNENVIFFVEDTGIGFSDEEKEIIFDRFKQVENGLTRKYSGAGLGLSISKALVKLLGGEIFAKSEKNQGSRFWFTVPFVKSEKSVKLEQGTLPVNGEVNWEGKTVMIAEDNEDNIIYYRDVLCDTKINIVVAPNGKEAFDYYSENKKTIDIILMDINMPVQDGYTTLKAIRCIDNGIPIIMQSAHAMLEDRLRAFRAGCNDYIVKPIGAENLLQLMARHI